MTDKKTPDVKFTDLGFNDDILKALGDVGYDTPTPIQAQAIPHILMMRDVVGIAQTGTGKTAAFTLPMIEILSGGRTRARMPRSLILSPTRELAAQIDDNIKKYAKYSKLNTVLLVGGESMMEQTRLLNKGVDILIATPGRLMDLFERGAILLTDIKIFVIDEADRMLDMGFIPDIEKIVGFLPPMRQTLMFTATMPDTIRKLADKFLSNPRQVAVDTASSTATTVKQFLYTTTSRGKDKDLIDLIKKENVASGLIFCNRKRSIDSLSRVLAKAGFKNMALHGDMSQSRRYENLDSFKSGVVKILICSDVAARGIDINNVTHVFNYDVPHHAEDYVHRIGRTGRAGKTGRAITLSTPEEKKSLDAVEKLIKNKIELYKGEKPTAKADDKPEAQQESKAEASPKDKPADKPKAQNKYNEKEPAPLTNPKNVSGFGDDVPAFFK